jgi:chromosome segregation ATPase|tara:strand:- start:1513 stop:2160 length:648 start_codon:yes stop_codon:yes gene_type:complete
MHTPPRTETKEDRLKELKDLQECISVETGNMDLLKTKQKDLIDGVTILEEKKKRLESGVDNEIEEKKGELANIINGIFAKRNELEKIKIKIEEKLNDVIEKESRCSELDKNIKKKEERMKFLKEEVLNKEIEHDKEMDKMKEESDAKIEEVSSLDKAIVDAKDILENHISEFNSKKKELDKKEERLNEKEITLDVYKRRIKRVYEKINPNLKIKI